MRILVACEESQTITKALRGKGHEAFSCDLQDCSGDNQEWHIKGDALKEAYSGKYDMMIAHPPCTYLSVSGLHWNTRTLGRQEKTDQALKFAKDLMNAPITRIAIENPVSCISSFIRKPDQIIHPYQFGDDASKATCLWLKNLPLLRPTKKIPPRIVNGFNRWGNQADDGQNVTINDKGKVCGWNTDEIKKIRSKTYPGIALAIADQWTKESPIQHSLF